MSASAEDEARARLEVAQLYEEMGQIDKAVRYLHGAAEILRSGGLVARARELYHKILKLEPANQAAQAALAAMGGATPPAAPPAAPGGAAVPRPVAPPSVPGGAAAPAPPAPAAAPARPPAAGAAAVLTPTPLLYRDANMIAAARQQLPGPPDYKLFPFDPLPRVDPAVVAARVDARRKAEEAARKKANPRVDSSFGNQAGGGFARPAAPAAAPAPGAAPAAAAAPSSSGAPASGIFGQTSGGRRPSQPAAGAHQVQPGRPAGEIRGGNRDLADLIAKRLKEGK